jgi:hypothetical protein
VPDVHARSLATSTALSSYYVPGFITPLEVVRVLGEAGVRFILVGSHGLGGWTKKPRATSDVDVLVPARDHGKALAVLLGAFPGLVAEEQAGVTRLLDRDTRAVRLDVLKPDQELYRAAFDNTHTAQSEGLTYDVPSLEMALVMKFSAMRSSERGMADRHFDAADFMRIVQENLTTDRKKLHELGQLVYNGGGDEVVENVRKVRAGEKMIL